MRKTRLDIVLLVLGCAMIFALFLLLAGQSLDKRIKEGNRKADEAIARSQEFLYGGR